MEQGEVEVLFCDLCGTSVPQDDVGAGRAVQCHGRTVGTCCLPALRGEKPASPPPLPLPPQLARRAAPAESRGTLLAVLVASAALATALFVDHRLTEVDKGLVDRLDQQAEAQKSDSQVVARMALDLDSVPRRVDTDALATAAGKAEEARADLDKRLDELAAAVAAVARQQEAAVDYRPLFEDLRRRQVRILEQIGAARAAAPVESVGDAKPATPSAPVADAVPAAPAAPAPAAPPAFAEQAKKLASAEAAVRFEGVDELIRSKSAEAVPLLLSMARDPDPFVRRLVIEGIAAWKRSDVVETLLAGLADGDEYVRDTAWRSLREVTAQKIPFEAAGGKDARARAVARWQEWWDKNKANFGA